MMNFDMRYPQDKPILGVMCPQKLIPFYRFQQLIAETVSPDCH